ncbi:MAG: YgaP family membrane protein [Rhizobiaceae bacterium]
MPLTGSGNETRWQTTPARPDKSPIFVTNVGVIDRGLRILAGTSLVVVAAKHPETGLVYAGIPGLAFLATGVFGWCGIYRLFGWKTTTEPSNSYEPESEDEL